MDTPQQLGLPGLDENAAWQDFHEWIHTPGGRHVAADLYRAAARYARRWRIFGRRVSMKLLWELERDQIAEVRRRLKRKGINLQAWKGYALNNNVHSYMARHIADHRPEWADMFETREIGKPRRTWPVFVRDAVVIQTRAAAG